MLRSVFLKTLRDQRRSLFWWGLGLVIYAAYIMFLYPTVREMPEYNQLLQQYPSALVKAFVGEAADFTAPPGYLNSTFFFVVAPALFLIFAVGLGGNAIAGEEARGTLDLLLANPLPRWRVVLEKFGAMVAAVAVLSLVLWLALALPAPFVEMDISAGRLAEGILSLALLGLVFGTLALAVGSAHGDRGLSFGLASALGLAAYSLNALAPTMEALEPYRRLSFFYYYIGADPLTHGLNLGHAAVLAGATLVLLAVGLLAFERRDVGV